MLIIVLSAIIILALAAYFYQSRQKGSLLKSIQQLNGQLGILEADNRRLMLEAEREKRLSQQLIQDKTLLEQSIRERDERLAALSDVENTINALSAQILALRSEAQNLKEESLRLKLELARSKKDAEGATARNSSAAELKKAINELRRQVVQVKRQIKNKTRDVAATGNQGFIIRDGKSTYPAKVRIEVIPVP